MIDSLTNPLRSHVRRLFPCRPFERAEDADLLRRFVADQDEEVFAEVVRRHGPLVFAVARRVLGHREDAEDVFQATFLILARKAGTISRQASLGSWLHGVATRLAHKARVTAARRRRHEQEAAVEEHVVPADDLRSWIDAELARLPETWRLPIVLCLLEGCTQSEAAAKLGWRPRTLKARLQRGKDVLRQRLQQRGAPASMPALAAALATSEAVCLGLRERTVRLAVLFARGALAEGPAVTLAGVGLRLLAWSRLQVLAAVLLVAGLAGLGVSFLVARPSAVSPPPETRPNPGKDLHGDALPGGATARLGTVRYRHPSWGLIGLAVTADGKTVVSVGEDGLVCFWETDSGKWIRRFHTGDLYPRGFALAPDGQLVALAGFRLIENKRPSVGSLQFRHVVTGKVVREIQVRDERMDSCKLAFSPDGKLLAWLNGNGVLRLTEVATGTELLREQFARDYAGPIQFSPDGSTLAVANGPNARKVFIWEWEKGKPPREIPVNPRGARSLSFSPDGKSVATGDDGQDGIRLWDIVTGRLVRQFGNVHEWDLHDVLYSPDGRYLMSNSYHERALVLWDPRTGKEVRRLTGGGRSGFGKAVFTADSRRLVATSGEGVIRVFDVATGRELSGGRAGHHQAPSFVELRRDGTAMTAGDDGSVRLWDARTGNQRLAIDVGPEWVRGAALSPDGRWLATSELGRKHAVRLWDARTGKQVYRLAGHGRLGGVRAVTFTADGKQFLSWGDDQYLRRWDVKTGKAIAEHRITPPGVPVRDDDDSAAEKHFMVLQKGAFSPDGSLLATAGTALALVDTRTAREKVRIPWKGDSIMGLAMTSDNKYLAASAWGPSRLVKLPDGREQSVSDGHFVSLFEVATGKRVHHIVVVKGRERIGPVAFSADGKRFAVGVGDVPARILLFDTATGKPAGTIENVPAAVHALGFSPDHQRLIGGLSDTTAIIWDLNKALKK